VAALGALAVLGCDRGPRADEDPRGPALRLLGSEPSDGAGLDCEPSADGCGVPTDTAITLRFDRFLLPSSAVRQSLLVYTGTPTNAVPAGAELTPRYDLVTRSVRYGFPPGFRFHPNALYTVELPIYSENSQTGFRAFDGAPLAGTRPVRFAFFTGDGPAATSAPPSPAPSCDEVAQVFAGCAECHGELGVEPAPRMGLSLVSWDGVATSAVGRPAHQTEIGETTGVTNEAPLRFGVNMPIIDPERPDNSYLLYKLLLRPEAYEPSPSVADDCSASDSCAPPAAEELERLRSWFVRGRGMPDVPPGESFVHHAEASLLERYIVTGAACP
jgi:hypothetical protein